MNLKTYVTFDGTCEAALNFYVEKLGGEIVMLDHFRDMPPGEFSVDNEHLDRVLHARMRLGGQLIYASDSFPGQCVNHGGFSLSAGYSDPDEARAVFDKLADGGSVTMPLAKMFWSPLFGICTDRFGISWMVSVEPEAA